MSRWRTGPPIANPGLPVMPGRAARTICIPATAGPGVLLVDVVGSPRPFVLDTSGGLTILAPSLLEAAGCESAGRLTGFRHDGGRLDLPRCWGAGLIVGGRERELDAAVLDLGEFGPTRLDSRATDSIFDGLLNGAFFAHRAVTFDLRGERPRLWVEATAPPSRVPPSH